MQNIIFIDIFFYIFVPDFIIVPFVLSFINYIYFESLKQNWITK